METNNNKKIKLVTHDGSFHSDDIFACATLALVLEKEGQDFEVIRTRKTEHILSGDYVFDVGGEYTLEKNIFDHHQVGGAGKRENGIEYASFGLVWKNFALRLGLSEKAILAIDSRLVAPIDAGDNGVDIVELKQDVSPYLIQNFFVAMRPTWKEDSLSADAAFLECVEIAKIIIAREIIQTNDAIAAEEAVVNIYNNSQDKRIIVLDKAYSYEYVIQNFPEPLFVIYPRSTDEAWGVKAVRANFNTFENKKSLPEAWAGLREEDFQKVSGVPDAIFCHRALFMAVAKSQAGAIKLAQIALQS